VCAWAYRNKPLLDSVKLQNREVSRVRCRVEHVFGYMTMFLGGLTCRVHGLTRVTCMVCCLNLAYNLKRYLFLIGK
jgi:hypothetical protein